MPFVPIVATAKVEIVAHHATTAQPIVNVLHIAAGGSPSLADVTAWANGIGTYYAANANHFSNEWVGDFVRVTDLNTSTGPQATNVAISGVVGTGGVGTTPCVAALVKETTTLRSRRGRGRIYHGPIPGAGIDSNGMLTTGLKTAIDSFYSGFQTALGALTPATSLVIASKVLGASDGVTTIATELLAGVQRRRMQR